MARVAGPAGPGLAASLENERLDRRRPFVGNLVWPRGPGHCGCYHVDGTSEAALHPQTGPRVLGHGGYQRHRPPAVFPGQAADELSFPLVVAGSGSKQITVTCGIGGAQTLPWPQTGEPREITTKGARCCQARSRAVFSRSPDPLSITIALTWAGIPRSGQMNNRAVAAVNATTAATSVMTTHRQRLPRR